MVKAVSDSVADNQGGFSFDSGQGKHPPFYNLLQLDATLGLLDY